MRKQLYRRYSVDEDTPVQFVGVYTTHWQPEWGEPEVMFAEIDDPLIDAAPQLLEALEAIRAKADLMMEVRDGSVIWADWQTVRGYASAAIAAAKGKSR